MIKMHTKSIGLTLYPVPNGVAICRNIRHDRTMIKKKDRERSSKKENWGSRHQRLFKENVRKTKKDKEWSTIRQKEKKLGQKKK